MKKMKIRRTCLISTKKISHIRTCVKTVTKENEKDSRSSMRCFGNFFTEIYVLLKAKTLRRKVKILLKKSYKSAILNKN